MSYIMDNPAEGGRIERKTDRHLTLEQLRWAGVGPGMTVLDLGCAAGTTCRIMAEIVGTSGRVVGVDISAARLAEARRHPDHAAAIEYRCGRADALPADDAEVDVAWSRFLFEYLPRPAEALREMIRATRVGGVVAVSDLDGNCIWHYPPDPLLQTDLESALRTLGDDFNPRVGLGLYTMFIDAGLEAVEIDIRPYHVIAGRIDPHSAELWRMKLDGVTDALVARGWPSERAQALARRFLDHLNSERTLTYSTLITVRGRKSPLAG